MPLSEQEQRLLDEMERHLMQHDADVVHASGGRSLSYRNLVAGVIVAIVGLGAIIAGVTVWQSNMVLGIVLGVIGFAAMLGGVILASTPMKNAPDKPGKEQSKPERVDRSGSFMDRLGERWDRRQNGE
ncbi:MULTISPECIES: DUF3040 domain-containing protein [unclassified Microbacterium]|uniref:DUF3040 domain-containing protein n=1 Tax=unclassified Microbacterium TaxID=2609290 RepID=UPI00097F52B9|nr:DUF3040 domain-containing protein [Microbacterium sp. JB110]RCS62732.1 DUF3040 domain-containing protein [Microbacterium sp. JB110]SJM63118.1 Membrane protein [Frigoribacterium sp. JB110]